MDAIFLSIVSGIAALGGGLLAFGKKHRLNLTLGFTAGALLGLVAFDLLPEIFEISASESLDIIWPMIALTIGF